MNELQLFNFEGNNVEVFEYAGEILFNPKDVGKCLDMAESTIKDHARKMNKNQIIKLTNKDILKDGLTNFRKLNNAGENFLKESGVYKLIFKSRKPSAERFQDWVTDEVLPSIRKTGQYNMSTPKLTERDNAILNILHAKDDINLALSIREFENVVTKPLIEEIDNLKELNNKLKTFIGKDGLIDVDTFSKTLNIKELGRNNMYKWLRENKYLMRNNKPYQHYINQGLFKLKSVGYRTNCIGEQIPLFKTYISIKGCGYLLDKLVNQGYIDFVKDFQNN